MSRPVAVIALIVLLACSVGTVMLLTPRPAQLAPVQQVTVAPVNSQPQPTPPPGQPEPQIQNEEVPNANITTRPPQVAEAGARLKRSVKANQKPAGAQSKAPKEPPADPAARVALSFVGLDPEAETYWIGAINDPGLPAKERQDLIEDLNEDGLSDPKHPGPGDLPVILNRLALIEDLAPGSMDQVNLDAFNEAYKDLLNLADIAQGGGHPVR